jgi:hypothetical protein
MSPRRNLRASAAVAVAGLLLLLLPAVAGAGLRTRGALSLHNAHNRVYENVSFQGRGNGYGDSSGVIRISGASHDITFKNCVIGTNQDGVGNGVKIVDSGAGMHDITFRNCTFKYQPRMGFECIGREVGSRTGYRRINLINCTFQASAGQAISYDDNNGTAGRCRIAGNLVKGAGVGTDYQWGKVFEINGTHNMTVTGNTFWAGRDGILNLQMRDTRASGWVFSNNVVDARSCDKRIDVIETAQPIVACNVYGGRFSNNRIINRDSWNIAYFSGCHGMDWRSTRWVGPNSKPHQTECSGNRF